MKLNEINIRDPFILLYEDTYYLYGSRTGEQLGFDVYKSNDLAQWSEPKTVFEYEAGFWGDKDFWAPEVHLYKGKFYMFASFKGAKCRRGTAVLVCDRPDGIFREHSNGAVTPSEWECLDGTLYISKQGIPYMVFCHEWVQTSDGEMCAVRLSKNLDKTEGNPFVLFKASQAEWSRPINKEGTQFVTDGPFMYRNRRGELYMLWSSMGDGNYTQGIAKSDNDELDGEWDLDGTLFEKDGGHGMLFKDKNGELYLVIHQPNHYPMERPVLIKVTNNYLIN